MYISLKQRFKNNMQVVGPVESKKILITNLNLIMLCYIWNVILQHSVFIVVTATNV